MQNAMDNSACEGLGRRACEGLGPSCLPRLRCRGSAPARCCHGRVSRAVVGAGDAVTAAPGRRAAWAACLCAVAEQPHLRRGHHR
jgi:hypothetical protein